MTKFDYRKWVTNYKTSNRGLFEQKTTGSASTGSASTGSASTGSASTGSAATGSRTGSALKRRKRKAKGVKEQIGYSTIGDDFTIGGTCYVCLSSSQVVDDLNNAGGLQQNGSTIVLGVNEFPATFSTYAPQCSTSYSDIVAGSTYGSSWGGFLDLNNLNSQFVDLV